MAALADAEGPPDCPPVPAKGEVQRLSQAVVIGSGMAGLAAAQVLSRHFDSVKVVERDSPQAAWSGSALDMARAPGARPGVAQYNQVHVLSSRGLATFDAVFNGQFTRELAALGAPVVDALKRFMGFHPADDAGRPWARGGSSGVPLPIAICTRHALESAARRLLERGGGGGGEGPRVSFEYGATVAGLTWGERPEAPGGGTKVAVTGVQLADGRRLPAQLVVDASGRGSALPSWLKAGGLPAPRTTRVSADCGYTGWFAELSPEAEGAISAAGADGLAWLSSPSRPTFALILRVEGGRWLVCVGGCEGRCPPKDHQGSLEFSKTVWHPLVSRLLEGSSPLSPPVRFRNLTNVWRHYEELRLPDGLAVLGDALCSFNPAYGQGITVAGREVEALERLLARRAATAAAGAEPCGAGWLSGIGDELAAASAPIVLEAWRLAAGSDARFPAATSNEPLGGSVAERGFVVLMDELFRMAAESPEVYESVMRVVQMVDSPASLLRPGLLGRALARMAARALPASVSRALPASVSRALPASVVGRGGGRGGAAAPPGGGAGGAADLASQLGAAPAATACG